ncbi:MgtC/SapB family protein [Soehngenia longivitae]|uniref:MgtC/SapB family protein n=1 Tax=Soehngenia longivitae TaxID=2562294 RepID=A0A4Z0D658_9FIRM|nr:MgtC/SapB family protein [Soehngenia longivitae]TFZ40367.1 MgtC/SapB family protein [Soehngenia longivitae]
MIRNSDIFVRLILAAIVGGLIGMEREASNRPAGFRTHILVSVGSTLMMLVSINGATDGADSTRIAAQVVSGIGFLGAGTILRNGNTIKGLTTAASLWVCAGIGLAIGQGFYFAAIVTSIIALLSLIYLGKLEKTILSDAYSQLTIISRERNGLIGEIGTVLGKNNITIKNIEISEIKKLESGDSIIEMNFSIKRPVGSNDFEFIQMLSMIEGINSVEIDGKDIGVKK